MDNGALGTPVDVRDVLAAERQALLDLLSGLDPVAWTVATVCPAWSVHELAVHIVHDDVRRLSADRDGHVGPWLDASTFDELVTELDRINQEWVTVVAPTMSPRMTRGALGWLATQTEQHLLDLEPRAVQASVAWAGRRSGVRHVRAGHPGSCHLDRMAQGFVYGCMARLNAHGAGLLHHLDGGWSGQ